MTPIVAAADALTVIDDRGARLTPAQLQRFRHGFAGDVILPGDAPYDEARRVWNAVFDRRPALIARPTSAADAAAAIRFARERDLVIAIRAGGHSPAGHSTCDDGLLIDLSAMRGVTVDPARRAARVSGGTLLTELDRAAQAHGLVCPVGVVGHTGVAGLTLGGGFGRLQRKLGLTIDNLRAVELLTADGELVRTSDSEHPDLFWAMRGAGPNFGLVTAFEFNLHPFEGTLTRGVRIYDARAIHDAWPVFSDFASKAPDQVSLTAGIALAEPAGDYPESVAGRPVFYIAFNHSGDPATAAADVAPLDAGPKPAAATFVQARYLDVQGGSDEAMGWGHRTYIKGAFANDLGPGTLDALVEHVATAPAEATFGITAQGGAMGRPGDMDTAFTGRTALLEVSADTNWTDPADDTLNIGWARRAMAILEPDLVIGRYVNEIAEAGPEETRAIYGDAKMARLTELKRAWDPHNVFRLNHNVAP